MDCYYPIKAPLKKAPRKGSKERAEKFTGEYQMNRRSITTDEKINSILGGGIINVEVNEDGYLLVTTDPYGRIMLTTDGPMAYLKAQFYLTMSFTALALIIILFIIVSSFVYWIIIKILGLIKEKKTKIQCCLSLQSGLESAMVSLF